jgi:hypothetical protein
MAVTTPHFAFPYNFNAKGQSVVVEQDSPGDLLARAANVAVCPVGFREDNPEYGIPSLLFQTVPLDIHGTQEAIARWAELSLQVSEHAEALRQATRIITAEVE